MTSLQRQGSPWFGWKQSCTSETVSTAVGLKWAVITKDINMQLSPHFSVLSEDLNCTPHVWALGLQRSR